MRVALFGYDMGIEMRVHLVDEEVLHSLLAMNWQDLVLSFEKSTLREMRPKRDTRLERSFDIDCEAEFLDFADQISGEGTVQEILSENKAHDALLKLIEWASPGHWEAWEGRCFIYIENAIGRQVDDVEEMYLSNVWEEIGAGISKMTENEFATKVCEDWMNRRKELGETLDEKEDPRIIPTFEAHDRTSRALHHALSINGYALVVGREHLPAADWGHGDMNLGHMLRASD